MGEFDARLAAMQAKQKEKQVAAAEALAVQRAENERIREVRRAELRSAMPGVADIVDSFRAVFGEVKVLRAEENGHYVVNKRALQALGMNYE